MGYVVIWCLALMAGVAALGVGVWLLRRWMFTPPEAIGMEEWSLQQLREMRSRGELSEAEFDRLRSNILIQYDMAARGSAETAGLKGAEDSAFGNSNGPDES